MGEGSRAFETTGLDLFAGTSVLFALCKITGVNDWSWWRVCLPIGGYLGFNLTYMATGFAYLSWIDFVANGTTETARIADDENPGLPANWRHSLWIVCAGHERCASRSEALNGFWWSFGSAGVMTAFDSLAIVNLVLFWSTNVQRHSEPDRTTKQTTS